MAKTPAEFIIELGKPEDKSYTGTLARQPEFATKALDPEGRTAAFFVSTGAQLNKILEIAGKNPKFEKDKFLNQEVTIQVGGNNEKITPLIAAIQGNKPPEVIGKLTGSGAKVSEGVLDAITTGEQFQALGSDISPVLKDINKRGADGKTRFERIIESNKHDEKLLESYFKAVPVSEALNNKKFDINAELPTADKDRLLGTAGTAETAAWLIKKKADINGINGTNGKGDTNYDILIKKFPDPADATKAHPIIEAAIDEMAQAKNAGRNSDVMLASNLPSPPRFDQPKPAHTKGGIA